MANIIDTIKRYQENFQTLPGIDISGSGVFLDYTHRLIKDFVMLKIEYKFGTQIDKYLLMNSDRLLYVNKKMLIQLLKSIFSEIQIFTNEQLRDSIYEGVKWISKMFKNDYNKWGLLTENLYKSHVNSTFKSPEWVASFAWDEIKSRTDKKNVTLLPFCVSDVGSGMNNVSTIKDMYENHGIQHFIMFDDGAYSGLQKSLAVFTHTWKELTSNPNVKTPFTIVVVIPFITVKAVDAFRLKASTYNLGFNREYIDNNNNYCEWEDTINKRSVFLWGGKVVMQNTTDIVYNKVSKMIPPTQKTYGICNDVYNFIIKDILTDLGGTLGASMCVFEHKLPDFVSLPTVVADIFTSASDIHDHYYNKNPPYKHIPTNATPDLRKVFDCYKIIATAPHLQPVYSGGAVSVKKTKETITYCKKKYTVLLSKRGHKYIIHNDRKVYLKSLHHL